MSKTLMTKLPENWRLREDHEVICQGDLFHDGISWIAARSSVGQTVKEAWRIYGDSALGHTAVATPIVAPPAPPPVEKTKPGVLFPKRPRPGTMRPKVAQVKIPTGWRKLKLSETLQEGDLWLYCSEQTGMEWVETSLYGDKVHVPGANYAPCLTPTKCSPCLYIRRRDA